MSLELRKFRGNGRNQSVPFSNLLSRTFGHGLVVPPAAGPCTYVQGSVGVVCAGGDEVASENVVGRIVAGWQPQGVE